ncbi:MAG: hypothetical protein IMW85_06125 [Thermicanus sp.]|nr:hypothetical protein [Thermicanus sp.]
MKSSTWIGLFLVLFGIYTVLEPYKIPYLSPLFTWESLFVLIGLIVVVGNVSRGKKGGSLFPGILLLGFGIHFLAVKWVYGWPTGWFMFALIFGLAFLADYVTNRLQNHLYLGLLFLFIAAYHYYPVKEKLTFLLSKWWPFLLMGIGGFLLFRGWRGKRR